MRPSRQQQVRAFCVDCSADTTSNTYSPWPMAALVCRRVGAVCCSATHARLRSFLIDHESFFSFAERARPELLEEFHAFSHPTRISTCIYVKQMFA